jgi:hypothetical protein
MQMNLDRAFPNSELLGNGFISEPLRSEPSYFRFPICQRLANIKSWQMNCIVSHRKPQFNCLAAYRADIAQPLAANVMLRSGIA